MQVQRLEAELAGRTPGSGVTVDLLTQAIEYRYAHTHLIDRGSRRRGTDVDPEGSHSPVLHSVSLHASSPPLLLPSLLPHASPLVLSCPSVLLRLGGDLGFARGSIIDGLSSAYVPLPTASSAVQAAARNLSTLCLTLDSAGYVSLLKAVDASALATVERYLQEQEANASAAPAPSVVTGEGSVEPSLVDNGSLAAASSAAPLNPLDNSTASNADKAGSAKTGSRGSSKGRSAGSSKGSKRGGPKPVTLEAYTAACELRAALAAAADVETGEVKDERVLQYFAEIGDVLAKLEPQSLPVVVEPEKEVKGEEAKPETEEGEGGEEKDKEEEAEKPAQPTLPMGPQVRQRDILM